MASHTQNAVAVLNALYNSRKATVANPNITMPVALRDRFLASYRKRLPDTQPDGSPTTNDQIAKVLLDDVIGPLWLTLDMSEAADLAAANRAQLAADLAPVVVTPP